MTPKDFTSRILPPTTRSLAEEVPPAPAGAIFVLAAAGGFASPRMRTVLHFGREVDDVHIPIGVNDPHVSRQHGRIVFEGREWWLHNDGRLPLCLPRGAMLLTGFAIPLETGYTPLFIGSAKNGWHLLEIHVVGPNPSRGSYDPQGPTATSIDRIQLSDVERLVMAALAQRYLRGERYPQPLSWNQVSQCLKESVPDRKWTPNGVAHRVSDLRERLSKGSRPIPGIRREDGVAEPVGNTLNHNLIQALLECATLTPADLRLLGDD